ncbi:MAG: hypothetical protein ACXWKG_03865 [Limisphaerales bacterium]
MSEAPSLSPVDIYVLPLRATKGHVGAHFQSPKLVEVFWGIDRMSPVTSQRDFMNGKSHSANKQAGGSSSRNALILGALGIVGLVVAIAVFNSGSPPRTATNGNAPKAVTEATATSGSEADAHKAPLLGAINPDGPADMSGATPKKIVEDIVTVTSLTNEVTAADAKKFHDGLNELVRKGAASVPAIQDYLDKNLDSNYGTVKGAEELGYSSVRHALLDTLKQIGGPESEGAMVHVLQTTAEPNEVGELAKDLEAQAPGQYRDQILQAAREALDMAYNGQLGSNIERGPLFRVFQNYNAAYSPPNASQQTTQ